MNARIFPRWTRSTRSTRSTWSLALGLLVACGQAPDDEDAGGIDSIGTGTGGLDGEGGGEGGEDGFDPDVVSDECLDSAVVSPTLRRLTGHEYEATIRKSFPELGDSWAGTDLAGAPRTTIGQFSNDNEALVVANQEGRDIFATAEAVADLVVADLPTYVACAGETADRACAQEFVETYGERLHRRRVAEDELAEYLGLFDEVSSASDFETGIRWMLVAMLQSPHTVYRSELGDGNAGEIQLRPFEVASAMSFAFGGQPPSDELLALARDGSLYDPEVRVEQARALLQTPRGRAVLHRFFSEWIGYTAAARADRLIEGSDQLDDSFAQAREHMVAETEMFLDAVVIDGAGTLQDLLLSDQTYSNSALATFYGYGAGGAPGFEPVAKPPEWGVGLLAQGSVLATFARPDTSSPTRRGLAVLDRLTCTPRPHAPDDVPPLEAAPQDSGTTTRQRWEQTHLGVPECAGCHQVFDPTGFAFEHFDAKGRYRATENGVAVDATGQVVLDGESIAVDGVADLATQLADSPQVAACVGGYMASFSYGGRDGASCASTQDIEALEAGDIGMVEFVAGLARSPHLTTRSR